MNNRATIFTVAVVSGLLLPVLAPGTANAQEWLRDRRLSEGAGIRAGDFEIHPGIAGEIGYDSNWFLRSPKEGPNITNGAPQAPVLAAGLLRITPSLSLSTLGPQRRAEAPDVEPPKVMFRAGLSATYREFFGDEDVRRQRNVSGGADARLDIMPQRTLGGAVYGNYVRTIQPNIVTANPDLSFNRDDVGAGAELNTQPHGGTLDWHFGYQFHTTIFEQDSVNNLFNNHTHEAYTRGRWKFRPRTALIYDGTLRFTQYSNPSENPGGLHNSTPVRARIGLNGLVTSRLALLALAGWGSSFFETGGNPNINQFDSIIGQAELKWFLSGAPEGDAGGMSLLLSSISVGYVRDFQNSYLSDFYGTDRGYLNLSYFFAGRALITFTGGVGAIEYPKIFFPDGSTRHDSWTDVRADATLFGEYRFADSLGINTTLRYSANFSDNQVPLTPARDQVFDMNWRRFEAFLGVRWFL
jgi:hypothetical protein